MTPHDLAEILLAKARDDARALGVLAADPEVADWIAGFHAQQAVEKGLKAVLTSAGVRTGRTHDLAQLVELLGEASIQPPDWLGEAMVLRRFAVAMRYAELEPDQPLDRTAAVSLVERVLGWAVDQVSESGAPS